MTTSTETPPPGIVFITAKLPQDEMMSAAIIAVGEIVKAIAKSAPAAVNDKRMMRTIIAHVCCAQKFGLPKEEIADYCQSVWTWFCDAMTINEVEPQGRG